MEKPEETEDTLTREVWYPFLKRARDFRNERLGKIRTGKIWDPMSEGPYCVLHWIPMSAETERQSIIDSFRNGIYNNFIVFSSDRLETFEEKSSGFLLSLDRQEDWAEWKKKDNEWWHCYRGLQRTQIFYSGEIEAAYAPLTKTRIAHGQKKKYVHFSAFEFFRRQIKNCIEKIPTLGFSGGVVIGISMLNLQGYSIHTPITPWHVAQFPTSLSHDEVLNSAKGDIEIEIKCKNFAALKNKEEKIMSDLFNEIWGYFGLIKCDRNWEDGSWEFKTHL